VRVTAVDGIAGAAVCPGGITILYKEYNLPPITVEVVPPKASASPVCKDVLNALKSVNAIYFSTIERVAVKSGIVVAVGIKNHAKEALLSIFGILGKPVVKSLTTLTPATETGK
jgi:hypothetical protein